MSFHNERVYCTECVPEFSRSGRRINGQLELTESNYSGTGSDMASCPDCGKGYWISYKVDKVGRAPDWDVDLEAEKRAEAEYKLRRAEQLEAEAAKLRGTPCKTS